jgi:hypothetical protein
LTQLGNFPAFSGEICRTSSRRPMSSLLFVSKIDQSEGLTRHN